MRQTKRELVPGIGHVPPDNWSAQTNFDRSKVNCILLLIYLPTTTNRAVLQEQPVEWNGSIGTYAWGGTNEMQYSMVQEPECNATDNIICAFFQVTSQPTNQLAQIRKRGHNNQTDEYKTIDVL